MRGEEKRRAKREKEQLLNNAGLKGAGIVDFSVVDCSGQQASRQQGRSFEA